MEKTYHITNKDLEDAEQIVKNHPKYGREAELIEKAIEQYTENTDKTTVAMKICLIDLTNGTNLMRNLGKEGGIYDLAEKITQVNFDERVKNGDATLINELAKWTKEKFDKNLFSFISKYCLYHNVHAHKEDDYVIYDSVLAENLGQYITDEEFKKITGRNLHKNSIKKCKYNYDYEEYRKIIECIIESNNLNVERVHRKMDWYIWNKHRPTTQKANKPIEQENS